MQVQRSSSLSENSSALIATEEDGRADSVTGAAGVLAERSVLLSPMTTPQHHQLPDTEDNLVTIPQIVEDELLTIKSVPKGPDGAGAASSPAPTSEAGLGQTAAAETSNFSEAYNNAAAAAAGLFSTATASVTNTAAAVFGVQMPVHDNETPPASEGSMKQTRDVTSENQLWEREKVPAAPADPAQVRLEEPSLPAALTDLAIDQPGGGPSFPDVGDVSSDSLRNRLGLPPQVTISSPEERQLPAGVPFTDALRNRLEDQPKDSAQPPPGVPFTVDQPGGEPAFPDVNNSHGDVSSDSLRNRLGLPPHEPISSPEEHQFPAPVATQALLEEPFDYENMKVFEKLEHHGAVHSAGVEAPTKDNASGPKNATQLIALMAEIQKNVLSSSHRDTNFGHTVELSAAPMGATLPAGGPAYEHRSPDDIERSCRIPKPEIYSVCFLLQPACRLSKLFLT